MAIRVEFTPLVLSLYKKYYGEDMDDVEVEGDLIEYHDFMKKQHKDINGILKWDNDVNLYIQKINRSRYVVVGLEKNNLNKC